MAVTLSSVTIRVQRQCVSTELLFACVYFPSLEPLTAPAGHNASADLGPELVTCSVYFYWEEVSDGQQKYCAV